eukprot:365502-Chlamydomonas_euryale.AAC.7
MRGVPLASHSTHARHLAPTQQQASSDARVSVWVFGASRDALFEEESAGGPVCGRCVGVRDSSLTSCAFLRYTVGLDAAAASLLPHLDSRSPGPPLTRSLAGASSAATAAAAAAGTRPRAGSGQRRRWNRVAVGCGADAADARPASTERAAGRGAQTGRIAGGEARRSTSSKNARQGSWLRHLVLLSRGVAALVYGAGLREGGFENCHLSATETGEGRD